MTREEVPWEQRQRDIPTDANHEGELGLRLDVEIARVLGNAAIANESTLSSAVLSGILLRALEDGAASLSISLPRGSLLGSTLRLDLGERLLVLDHGLRDRDLSAGSSLGRHGIGSSLSKNEKMTRTPQEGGDARRDSVTKERDSGGTLEKIWGAAASLPQLDLYLFFSTIQHELAFITVY